MAMDRFKRRRARKQKILEALNIDSSQESQPDSTSADCLLEPPPVVSFSIKPPKKEESNQINDTAKATNTTDNQNTKNITEKSMSGKHKRNVDANSNRVILSNNDDKTQTPKISNKVLADISEQEHVIIQAGHSKIKQASICAPLNIKNLNGCSTPKLGNEIPMDCTFGSPIVGSDEEKLRNKAHGNKAGICLERVTDGMKNRISSRNTRSTSQMQLHKRKSMINSCGLMKPLFEQNLGLKMNTRHSKDNNGLPNGKDQEIENIEALRSEEMDDNILEKNLQNVSRLNLSKSLRGREILLKAPSPGNSKKHKSYINTEVFSKKQVPGITQLQSTTNTKPYLVNRNHAKNDLTERGGALIEIPKQTQNEQQIIQSDEIHNKLPESSSSFTTNITKKCNKKPMVVAEIPKLDILSIENVNLNMSELLNSAKTRTDNNKNEKSTDNGVGNNNLSCNNVTDCSKITESSQEVNRTARLQSLVEMEQWNKPGPSGTRNTTTHIDRTSLHHQGKIQQNVKKVTKHNTTKVKSKNEEENYFHNQNDSRKKKNATLNKTVRRPLYSADTDIDSFIASQQDSNRIISDEQNVVQTHSPANEIINVAAGSESNDKNNPVNTQSKRATLKRKTKTVLLESDGPLPTKRSSTRTRFKPTAYWIHECRIQYDYASDGYTYNAKAITTSQINQGNKTTKGKRPTATTGKNQTNTKQKIRGRGRYNRNNAEIQPSEASECPGTLHVEIGEEAPQLELPLIDESNINTIGTANADQTPIEPEVTSNPVNEMPTAVVSDINEMPNADEIVNAESSVVSKISAIPRLGVRRAIEVPSIGLTECFSRPASEMEYHDITDKLSQAVSLKNKDMQTSYLKFKPQGEKKAGNSFKNDFLFFVLKGRVSVRILTAKTESETGEFFFVPQGTKYHIRNRTDDEVILVCVSFRRDPTQIKPNLNLN